MRHRVYHASRGTNCSYTFGLEAGLDLGLLVATAEVFVLVLGLAAGDEAPVFDTTLGLDFATAGDFCGLDLVAVDFCVLGLARASAAAFALALGLSLARSLSNASSPIRLPDTYDV